MKLGEVVEGGERLRQALHLAQEREDLLVQAWTHSWLADWACYSGETAGAVAHGRAAVEAAERIGSAVVQVQAYRSLGLAVMKEGDLVEARSALEHALDIHRDRLRMTSYVAPTVAALAEVYQLLGQAGKVEATIEQACTLARRFDAAPDEVEAQLAHARILIRSGRREERARIEAALARVLEIVIDRGLHVFLPLIALEQAHLAELLGNDAEHRLRLSEAHRLFTEIGATGHAERLARELRV